METRLRDFSLLIAGRAVPAASGALFERRNPLSGAVVTRAAAATVADARAAADAAAAAFPAWSALGPGPRRHKLLLAADRLERRRAALVDTMMAETGAARAWAGHNVDAAAAILREAAYMTTRIQGEVIPSDEARVAMAMRCPVGVVLGIAPWNAPVVLGVRAVAMALACGNTAILKASDVSPGVHVLIGEAMIEAGLDGGIVNVVTHAPADAEDVVGALIDHPAVRRVNFTGSTRVGRVVARRAAEHLKPVLLELGGKAPCLVLDDADLDAAVRAAAFGAFFNQGQICMSTERILVADGVAEAFVDKLAGRARGLTAGDPASGGHALGALADPLAHKRINALIADAVAQGARVVAGGDARGALMSATVLDGVTPAMRIFHEETFGPVVCVTRVADDEQAVALANQSEYGLSASVFGSDAARALNIARRLETGICHINGATVSDEPQMPFGGVKATGYGRFGGSAGVAEFTELRWVTIATGAAAYPI
nr:aldehyde dehydrogenase family protein [Cupriavidus basilensis]